jgi:hypothetical protein
VLLVIGLLYARELDTSPEPSARSSPAAAHLARAAAQFAPETPVVPGSTAPLTTEGRPATAEAPVASLPAAVFPSGPEQIAAETTVVPRAPASPAPGNRPAAPIAGARKTNVAARPAPLRSPGTLELTVAPTGEVFIDGKSRGQQAGTVKYELPAGDHQIDVKGATHWGPKSISIQAKKVTAQSAWVN